ncbi:Ribosome biogenesis protein [Wickerhamomyces ciferrii]|uniref:Ribosome biogenesis protein n=1 Tax=Wickerhamomyces ciferrii (strain ATCC 14091 / BCRC 22168 / CBS 111 / JCM 3599 / NBRC 0793 / NRRL Y-1031 F-60-10) TaxID=1206466 RepID=K0KKC2_WICCF|nr:Ribosome biogenesis protein [Wickerhamomyces ciferrii]CCH45670.1 Ribosome biogenesis protein [Wickerhamomyces ciferrii]
MDGQQSNKSHRGQTNKNTAKKKLHTQGFNAKAFAVAAPKKLERMARRSHDVNERKLHVPMVDRTPDDDPPPVIVAVVGPPGTGKTTLIRSLVRRLTKHTLSEIKGPITVVSGKRRRLTFIEVANDMNSMIDAAKIADLVLLMVDGNFGLEMETMEFLNIAQHHGMPRVLGVTTHLDLFKSQATLRTSKKRLKSRFWTEVYSGAKLFYLSGVINGRYPDREILNLSRFISVMKFRPLKWRNEHPYLLADRITDLTHPTLIEENNKCDRKVAVYGYLHGTPLPHDNARIHIAGVGDYTVSSVEKLPDPCPTPYFEQKLEEIEREKQKQAIENGEPMAKTTRRRKRLDDKQKIIYAPMSDVGGVLVDKDAVYIDVGQASFVPGEEKGVGEQLVTGLQSVDKTIDERFQDVGLQIFSNGAKTNGDDYNEDEEDQDEEESEEEQEQGKNTGRSSMRNPRVYGKPLNEEDDAELNSDAEDDNDEGEDARRKLIEIDFNNDQNEDQFELEEASELDDDEENGWRSAASRLQGSVQRKWDISKMLYLNNIEPADVIKRWKQEDIEEEEDESSTESNVGSDEEEDDDDFFKKKTDSIVESKEDKFIPDYPSIDELKEKWNEDTLKKLQSRFFVSAKKIINDNDEEGEGNGEDDEELYGDFEDLEAEGNEEGTSSKKSNNNDDDDDDDSENSDEGDDFADFEAEEEKGDEEISEGEESEEEAFDPSLSLDERRALNAKKKEKLRLQFEAEEGGKEIGTEDPENEEDTWYEIQKAKMAKQLDINKAEFESMDPAIRARIEGYRAGSYVRLVFEQVPPELIENFNPKYPLVLGGLLPSEERFGYMDARIRRHRWHKKILKSNDPLILSLGWRRFQTLPVYTTSDSRTRTRMLKYTPEHTYCSATFYGPLVAPSTTFCAVQVVANSDTTGSFRISATGVIDKVDSSTEIVKKLKLVGYPQRIERNTAFIKDMFTSSLEVARFEGAQIKTVSGIRGEIKRAMSKPEGNFRATFEDKIIMSDIVILRTWYPVGVKKFYNPVTSHLLNDQSEWKGMRLTGQIRAANNIELQNNNDSLYSKIERPERHFNGLKIPKSIKADLPFKSQVHEMKPQKKKTYMAKRAVVLNGEEKKARALMQKLATISKAKDEKKKATKDDKRKERLKKLAKLEEIKSEKDKERKKDYFARVGKKRGSCGGDDGGDGKKRRL